MRRTLFSVPPTVTSISACNRAGDLEKRMGMIRRWADDLFELRSGNGLVQRYDHKSSTVAWLG